MQKHYKLKILGKVQGVWYRGSTRQKAQELGVKGFVQNETDGSVYAEIEGDEAQLQQLIDWCKQGPELARVQKVEVTEGVFTDFKAFEIRR